jgi:hypothetical protein
MSAPNKKGLDYFRLDTDISQDRKMELLEAEFGIKGFGILIKLLIRIYRDEGYFLKWDDDMRLLFANRVGISSSLVDEVINGAVRRGFFDKSVFDSFGILTSSSIQKRYFNAIKRRESIDLIKEYLLTSPKESIKGVNVNINSINVNNNSQSREEESREEESREDIMRARIRELSYDEFPKDDKISRFTIYCWKQVKENYPDHKTVNKAKFDSWHKPLRLLIENDGIDIVYARKLFNWATNESFWQTVIRSTSKFRDKFEDLDAQFKRNSNHSNHGKPNIQAISDDIDEIMQSRRAAAQAASAN